MLGATLVDMWRMRDQAMAEVMDTDRMHLNPVGHQHIAFAVLEGLGVLHDQEPLPRITPPALSRCSGTSTMCCPCVPARRASR